MKNSTRIPPGKIGMDAEQQALKYLYRHKLTLLERNFRCRYGEIDLIMMDMDCLVFVEVRYRKHVHFGTSAETVTKSKQQKIIIAAQHYLQNNNSIDEPTCRFDVIAVSLKTTRGNSLQFNWIKNAFQVEV